MTFPEKKTSRPISESELRSSTKCLTKRFSVLSLNTINAPFRPDNKRNFEEKKQKVTCLRLFGQVLTENSPHTNKHRKRLPHIPPDNS